MSHDQEQQRRRADSSPMTETSSAQGVPGRTSRSSALRRPENPVPSALAQPQAVQAKAEPAHAAEAAVAEPSWVAGARAFNAAHGHWVTEFNDLTNHACVERGQLDPQKVQAWQAPKGLVADGKVGPQTVRVARCGRAANDAMWEKARAFNAKHPDLVAQFNDATAYFCFDFDQRALVPEQVAKWQMKHGEPADGMITQDTIAAAKAKTAGAIS